MRITYDKAYKQAVIKGLGLKKGQDGLLVNEDNQPILDDEKRTIKYKQFAGIQKGSVHYFQSDLPSLILLSRRLRDK